MRKLAVLAFATVSIAAASGEPLRVEWSAHDECPTRDAWWQSVVTRSSRLRRAAAGESAHTARIEIVRSGGVSVGSLTIDDAAPRHVSAPQCSEVVEALAFMTVVALDPAAAMPTPTAASSVTPSPSVLVSPVPSIAAPEKRTLAAPPARLIAAPPPTPSWQWKLSAGASVLQTGAGSVLGIPFGVELQHGMWGTAFRAAALRSTTVTVHDPRGPSATFVWTMLRVHACQPALSSGALFLHACLGFDGGVIEGKPRSVTVSRGSTRPWLVPFVFAQLEWRVVGALALELDAGVGMPLLRDEFVVDPDYFLYRPPVAVFRGGIGVKVRFL